MKLKIMSFNVRVNTDADGINSFTNRRCRVKECIMNEKPDIIGIQEANDEMTEWMKKDLRSRYYIIGTGREKDLRGEGARIAYNKNKFDLVYLDTRWLSETDDIPGSRFSLDQSLCPRVYTVAEFVEKRTRKIFRVFNAHLDHEGEKARLCGAVQIISRIQKENQRLKCVNILTGDFNAVPGEASINTFDAHLKELTRNVGHTFHEYGKRPVEKCPHIDYIYTDGKSAGEAYKVKDEPKDGVYVSDHYPICAFVEI